ncbi:MAG TPA: DUF3093 domain-containing protein [Propionibacteriaceae bacterium]|nr:DUF3093 domain-containing protein [Propionibacteriaceae bacterium]
MRYSERLHVPFWYWLLALFLASTLVVAVWAYFGDAWVLLTAVICLGAVALVLLELGRTQITVGGVELQVAGARIEGRWLGEAVALDATATRRRLGPDADVHAWLVGKPYLAQAVEVPVIDAADPHPYWLISTRRPGELADAINALPRADA